MSTDVNILKVEADLEWLYLELPYCKTKSDSDGWNCSDWWHNLLRVKIGQGLVENVLLHNS